MEKPIGKVTHYYDKIGVAVVELNGGKLKVGDEIKFKKEDDEFTQKIESLQIEHKNVDLVKKGDAFGLKTDKPVKVGTKVILV